VRLFVALQIPASVRENFAVLIEQLRETASRVSDKRPRWVRAENLHVTLKFIGEAAPEKLQDIRGALNAVRSDSLVNIKFGGLGFFPDDKRPKVFWAGIQATGNLAALAGEIDSALSAHGFPRGTRAFAPHLTLARFEPPGMQESLRGTIQAAQSCEFGSFQTREFHLIESKTKPTGAEYTVLQSFTFAPEA
jgi:2'-5' RNA ligase